MLASNDSWERRMNRLTSFDEVRRAAASITLLCTEAFTFLKPAITDIGTVICKQGKLVLGHNIQLSSCLTKQDSYTVENVKDRAALVNQHKGNDQ